MIKASDTIQGHTKDSTMAGYWEMGPNSVLFGNPYFEEYLKSKILPPLAAQLFPEWAEISLASTSLEFEKLVLYESHFRYVKPALSLVNASWSSDFPLPVFPQFLKEKGEIITTARC